MIWCGNNKKRGGDDMEEQIKTKKARGKKARRSIIASFITLTCIVLAIITVVLTTKIYAGLELAVLLILFLPFIIGACLLVDLICSIISIINLKYQFKLNKRWPAWLALGLLIGAQLLIVILIILL